jgi:hypothetical protein
VNIVTVDWIVDLQQIGHPTRVNTYHVVDLLSSKSPA